MDFRLMLAAFMARLVKAGQMLGDIWYTAWLEAPEANISKSNCRDATQRRREQGRNSELNRLSGPKLEVGEEQRLAE